ncbi:hypothetical protein KC19_VG197800 [Ceratodon purpureus]|uniref:Uncharacterized protein n=1 Tax=Ceratodon purpureus TaxID=3225 RepID=A0A8T0HT15_CERPU|nr:hypothetical protein KC19_VG197800 [Ceratodon purpureus]
MFYKAMLLSTIGKFPISSGKQRLYKTASANIVHEAPVLTRTLTPHIKGWLRCHTSVGGIMQHLLHMFEAEFQSTQKFASIASTYIPTSSIPSSQCTSSSTTLQVRFTELILGFRIPLGKLSTRPTDPNCSLPQLFTCELQPS